MNVLSLFDGMACGMIAFKELGIDVTSYDAYEIDKYAIKIAKHNFPMINELGDVFNADFTKYKNIDWLIGGSPCFVAGTKVMTYNGIKSIEDVQVGDMVLTHMGRYRRVKEVMQRTADDTVIVKAENCGAIQCTKEHPFYTKTVTRVFNAEKRQYNRVPNAKFNWIAPVMFNTAKNTSGAIKEQTYLTSVFDEIKEIPQYSGVSISVNQHKKELHHELKVDNPALWYLIGRWVGDGWFNYKYKPSGKKLSGIKICCGKNETFYLASKIEEAGYKYTLCHEATVDKFQISNVELATYLTQFGDKASGKYIPGFVTRLTDELANSFLIGYFDADGHNDDYIYSYCTISKDLAYGIKYMVNKYIKAGCSINVNNNTNGLIEGRNCVVKPLHHAVFHMEKRNQSHYINEGNYILAPYKSVTMIAEPTIVYNLSVEEDESYTANGLVVHNCTYWSIAQTKNREVLASGIGWELFSQYVKALNIVKPKYFLYENNKSMSKQIRTSIDAAFGFEAVEINSAIVSAQTRKRLYWVGKLNEDGTYSKVDIKQPEDKGLFVKDILDNAIAMRDKSHAVMSSIGRTTYREYFIKNQGEMCAYPVCVAERGRMYRGQPQHYEARTDGKTNTITSVEKDNRIAVPIPFQVGSMPRPNGELSTSQGFRIYDINYKSVTLKGNAGGSGGKTGLYAIRYDVEFDDNGTPINLVDEKGKKIVIYEVRDGKITVNGNQYPIKLDDGYYIIRKLTVTECARLQTIPEWYDFSCISNSRCYQCIGNGWTIEVIKHIISETIKNNA